VIKLLILIVLLIGVPATTLAEEEYVDRPPRVYPGSDRADHGPSRLELYEDPAAGDSWYARVIVRNFNGAYNRIETLETSKGPVTFQYFTSSGSASNDIPSMDDFFVLDLPSGVVADPMQVQIFELDKETIYLYEYISG